MAKLFLLFGSNIGNRSENISKALTLVSEALGVIGDTSSFYETAAWGNTNQASFYNLVCTLNTITKPELVLEKILAIEESLGRVRNQKWEARIIDIDILYYDDLIVDTPQLKIPHPLLQERRFTLMPLDEIEPNFIHPSYHLSNSELLERCTDALEVEKVSSL